MPRKGLFMKSYIVLALTFFVITLPSHLFAQIDTSSHHRAQMDTSMVRITLKDGSTLNWQVVGKDSTTIVLLSNGGMKSDIPRSNIESVERLVAGPNGSYIRTDPN